ncbi:MAG: branched-chain amino acid ABC transporter permease [Candidatus Promineifilaceae bacterium]|nr:branched-chain amino acid ABC transporter permease [Candidatus Promineifilaceae bacterium]
MKNGRLWKNMLIAVLIIFLILLPFVAGQYTITTLIRIIYFGFLAVSTGFLIGQGGMLSLAQAAFFGIAGYALGLLGYERGVPFPIADILAIVVVLLFAAVFGLIANRATGIVFLMITLAFGQVVFAFALQNTTFLHGWAGIRGIRPPILFGIDFRQTANFYWATLFIYIIGLFILWRIVKSPFGLILNGTRESADRMDALGYPTYWIKVVAFLIAAVYAGIGGLIATYNTGVITPTTMQLPRMIWILLMVILGGAGYFWGPVVGAIVVVWLDVLISQVTERYNLVIGIIFVFTVLFSPNGILGYLDSLRKRNKIPFLRNFDRRKMAQEKESS